MARAVHSAARHLPGLWRPWSASSPGRFHVEALCSMAVTLHLPGPLHHRIREDAESRGETVEAWLLAEARAIFEPEPEGEGNRG